MAGYDDRDGFIWMDGKLVEWRDAKVHILTHALHYASAVFEGERCYNGKIFKSTEHSERLLMSGELLDMPIPYTAAQIDAAKVEVLKANGLTDAYVRAIAFRGAGDEMGVAALANPVRLAIACWTWGAYYGDAKFKGAKLDISKWKRPSPETIPSSAKASGLYMICTMSKHAAMAKLFATETAAKVCDQAARVFASYGYAMEYPVQRYLRDVRFTLIGGGTSEILKLIIAKEVSA